MSRLLFITNGLSGGLNASFELARRLTDSGHQVGFLGHRDLDTKVTAHGFDYQRVTGDETAMAELKTIVHHKGQIRALPEARRLRSELVATSEFADGVRDLAPDALIIDVEAHVAILSTEGLALPRMLKSDWFSMARRRGIPPLHSPLPLPHSFATRRRADLAWAQALGERCADNTVKQLHPNRFARRMAPFRYDTIERRNLWQVARANGLRLRDVTSQTQWLRPHVYTHLPMMSTTAAELDFGVETLPNAEHVGPLVHRDRVEATTTPPDRERWHAFRDRNASQGRPLIYCSFGTFLTTTSDMTNKVISAVAATPAWDLVVGLGGLDRDAAQWTVDAPDNVLLLDHAPQVEVLRHADLAVIHGGINSVNECMTFGVPMLIDGRGGTDGPGNAARMRHHGVAAVTDITSCSVSMLQGEIAAMMDNAQIAAQVLRMQEAVAAYETDRTAERFVERILATARPR